MNTDCVVVIPTYNEAENIANLIARILLEPRFAVLVVDDNSPDGTGQIVADIAKTCARVRLLSRAKKEGLGRAYVAGFHRALAGDEEYIFQMDADFSHDPIYLPKLLAAIEGDFDVAIGSRYVKGGGTTDWGVMRQTISSLANLYARTILGLTIRDCTGGFRGYRREVLEHIDLDSIKSDGYSFIVELGYRATLARYRITEIPIIFPDRRVGKSKLSVKDILEAIFKVWQLRLTVPRRRKPTA